MLKMASSVSTHAKKRTLLRSLGSKRRQKHITDSFPTKKPGETNTVRMLDVLQTLTSI